MSVNESVVQAMTMAGLNLIQQALSIYDNDLNLVLANARFQEMFDLPGHLLQPGTSFEDTIRFLVARGEYGEVDDFEEMVSERVERAKAFEAHYLERQRENGRWVSVEGTPLPNGGWVAVYTDITRTKRQEGLLRTRSEELSDQLLRYAEDLSSTNRELESTIVALEEAKRQIVASEARMRLTTEMMPAHVAHVGPDRIYTFSNRRLSSVMPGRPKNVVGTSIETTLAGTYVKIKPHLDAAFNGEPQVFEFNDSMSSRRIRLALTPDGEQGDKKGVYILSMDITEETQTRAALQQTRRRELAAQMTSGLAHDFSNLLTIILGMQGKLAKMDLSEKANELISGTLSAAHRGGELLNRLADMTSQRTPKLVPTSIANLFSELQILSRPAVSQGVDITFENNVPNRQVLTDIGMLQDSMLNLILNARDACGQKGAISVKAEVEKETWLRIEVRDSGDGFSEEALEQAFDPFFTTKGADGSGLGLPMVYDSTQVVGGRVSIRNVSDGACVTLKLPLRWVQERVKPGLTLLVEDNSDLRSIIRDMLISLGCHVIEATSVKEALDLFEQVPDISLVLSDIKLEGEATGIDLLQQISDKKVPTYLMTSFPQSHPLYLEGAAIAPIIRKPFDSSSLSKFLSISGGV